MAGLHKCKKKSCLLHFYCHHGCWHCQTTGQKKAREARAGVKKKLKHSSSGCGCLEATIRASERVYQLSIQPEKKPARVGGQMVIKHFANVM